MKYLLILLFVSGIVQAKPIDISKISKKDGLTTTAEGTLDYERGFSEVTELGAEVAIQYKKGKNLGVGIFEGETKEEVTDTETKRDRRNLQHFRHRVFQSEKFGLESFLQREEDTDKSLTLGYVYGTGPFYRVFQNYFLTLLVGTAVVRETEEYREDDNEQATRSYTYGSAGIRLPQKFLLGVTVQTEPKFSDTDDNRVYTKSSLKYRLEKNITIGLKADTVHDKLPPTNTPRSNKKVQMVIGVEF